MTDEPLLVRYTLQDLTEVVAEGASYQEGLRVLHAGTRIYLADDIEEMLATFTKKIL